MQFQPPAYLGSSSPMPAQCGPYPSLPLPPHGRPLPPQPPYYYSQCMHGGGPQQQFMPRPPHGELNLGQPIPSNGNQQQQVGGAEMPFVPNNGVAGTRPPSQPAKPQSQPVAKDQLPPLTRGQQSRVKELLRELRRDHPHLKISEALLRERVLDAAARGMSLATVTAAAVIESQNNPTVPINNAPQTAATSTIATITNATMDSQAQPNPTEQQPTDNEAESQQALIDANNRGASSKAVSALIPAAAIAADQGSAVDQAVDLEAPIFKEVAKNRREHRGGLSKRRWLRRQQEQLLAAATEGADGVEGGSNGSDGAQGQSPAPPKKPLSPASQPFIPSLPSYEQANTYSGQLVRCQPKTLAQQCVGGSQQQQQATVQQTPNSICIHKEVLRSAQPLIYHYHPEVEISPQSRNLSPAAALGNPRSLSPGNLLPPTTLNPASAPWMPSPSRQQCTELITKASQDPEPDPLDQLKSILDTLLPVGTDLNVTPSTYLNIDAQHSIHRFVPQLPKSKVEDYKQLVTDAKARDDEDSDEGSDEEDGGKNFYRHLNSNNGNHNANQKPSSSSGSESTEYEVIVQKKNKKADAKKAAAVATAAESEVVKKTSPNSTGSSAATHSLVVGSPVDSLPPQRATTANTNFDAISLSSFISGHVSDEGGDMLRQSSVQAVMGKGDTVSARGSVSSSMLLKKAKRDAHHKKKGEAAGLHGGKPRRHFGSGSLSGAASLATSSSSSCSSSEDEGNSKTKKKTKGSSSAGSGDEAYDSNSAIGCSGAEGNSDDEIEQCPRLRGSKKRKSGYAGPCKTRMIMTADALRDTFNAIASDRGLMVRLNRDGHSFYADSVSLTALATERMLRLALNGKMRAGGPQDGIGSIFQHPLLLKDRPEGSTSPSVVAGADDLPAPHSQSQVLDVRVAQLPSSALSTASKPSAPVCEVLASKENRDKALAAAISYPEGARDEALLAKAIVNLREGIAQRLGKSGNGAGATLLTSKALAALSGKQPAANTGADGESGPHGYSQVIRWNIHDQLELVVGSDLPVVGAAPVSYDPLVMSSHSIDSLATAPSQRSPRLDDLAGAPSVNHYTNSVVHSDPTQKIPISMPAVRPYPDPEDPSAVVGDAATMLLAVHAADTAATPQPTMATRQLLPPIPPSSTAATSTAHGPPNAPNIAGYSWAQQAPPEGFAATRQAPFTNISMRPAAHASSANASSKPTYTLTRAEALEYWFDTVVANVSHVGIVVHKEGIVQALDVVSNAELLAKVPGGLILAQESMKNMQKILQWLINGTKGDGEYVLFRKDGNSDFEIYEIPPNNYNLTAGADNLEGNGTLLHTCEEKKRRAEMAKEMGASFADTDNTLGNTDSGATPLSAAVPSSTFANTSCNNSVAQQGAGTNGILPVRAGSTATVSSNNGDDGCCTSSVPLQRSATATSDETERTTDKVSCDISNASLANYDLPPMALRTPTNATVVSSDGRSCSIATATPTVATTATASSGPRAPTPSSSKCSSNISTNLCSFLLKHADKSDELHHDIPPQHLHNVSSASIGLDCNNNIVVLGDNTKPGESGSAALENLQPLKPASTCACEKAKQQRLAIIKAAEEEQRMKDEAEAKAKQKAREDELRAKRHAQKDVLRM